MTRYARAQGSKGCHSRHACPATPWQEFKEQIVSDKSNAEEVSKDENPSEDGNMADNDTEGSWFSFQDESKSGKKNAEALCSSYVAKRKHIDDNLEEVSMEEIGYKVKKTDFNEENRVKISGKRSTSELLERKNIQMCETSSGTFKVIDIVPCIKKSVREKKTSRPSFREKISPRPSVGEKISSLAVQEKVSSKPRQLDLRDSRRMAKALKREKKKVCFCCRRWGHQLADCPEAQKDSKMDVIRSPGVFCYNCGSTEHRMSECNKPGRKSFKFANCFVCGEEGHLARLCPDNPKGSYPKGGSCHLCGEVTHLRSDCPKAKGDAKDLEPTLACTTTGPIESLPEDFHSPHKQPTKTKKIVQFT